MPLIVFFVLYFMMSVVTTGLSVSAGMFIPALLSGAAWGRLVGIGMENCFPDSVSSSGSLLFTDLFLNFCYLLFGLWRRIGGRKERIVEKKKW